MSIHLPAIILLCNILMFHTHNIFAANSIDFQRFVSNIDFNPLQIARADFNNDGIQDLLFLGRNKIKIMYGSSAGTMVWGQSTHIGKFADNVVIADFNSDSTPDIAIHYNKTTYPYETKIQVFLAKLNGIFSHATTIANSVYFEYDASDINGDGITDLVIGHNNISANDPFNFKENNVIRIWTGLGNGKFRAGKRKTSNRVINLYADDLNKDHWPDLIAVQEPVGSQPNIVVYLGQGQGKLKPHVKYRFKNSPRAVDIADFNNDGYLDLFMVFPNNLSVLLGSNGSFFNTQSLSVPQIGSTVVSGDINGDDYLDIVTTINDKNGLIRIFYGQQSGKYTYFIDYPAGAYPSCVQIADLNNNGMLDIVVSHRNSQLISLLIH